MVVTMISSCTRSCTLFSRIILQPSFYFMSNIYSIPDMKYSKVSMNSAPAASDFINECVPEKFQVNLDKMFWSVPQSLALPPDSPFRIEEPKYEGIQRLFLKMLLFYSKQSKSIRAANVVYMRVANQVNKPAIYEMFNMEKTFKTTFSLLVLHMWLYLRRLKEEGGEGSDLGQNLYEIYNHDVEIRVSKAGVNLLLTRWMKDLEKIFYGNIIAYDAAMSREAKLDDLANTLWKNVLSDDGISKPDAGARIIVQALARYTRREFSCLSLTDREAILSGNFMFTSLENSC